MTLGPLHTVSKSPFASDALESCLRHITEGAAILLMEDGIYAALAAGRLTPTVVEAARLWPIYALGPDLSARGCADKALVEGVKVIGYEDFVDLAARHSTVQAWF